jgi:phosphatidylinositol dimannoside acyltransferase
VISDRLVDAGYALGWTVVRKMPEPLAARLFRLIADRVWRRRGRSVLQLEKNLRRVVGDEVPESALRDLSRAGMRSYMRYWLEAFRLPEISADRIMSGMRITGQEKLFSTLDSGRGVIVALPHMGNYDQAGAWLALNGHPFTTVMERLKPEALFDRFMAFRESLGMEVLPASGGTGSPFATLAERLTDGRVVCMVVERDLGGNGIEVDFFGRPAKMPAGSAALAVQTGAALMPVTLWFEGNDWGARIHEEIPVPDAGDRKQKIQAITQAMVKVFEEGIAAHPQDWHMLQRVWLEDLR